MEYKYIIVERVNGQPYVYNMEQEAGSRTELFAHILQHYNNDTLESIHILSEET